MKNLNKIEMIPDIQEDLVEIVSIVNDIVSFDQDPEKITDKYLREKELDVFEDIARGLQGEFTRDKSIILGRGLLVKYLNDEIADIDEDTMELAKEYKSNLTDIIRLNIDSLTKGIDSKVLKDKANEVLSNPVRREYLGMKLDTILNRSLDADIVSDISIEKYLTAAVMRLESMNDKFITEDGRKVYESDSHLTLTSFKHAIDVYDKNTVLDDTKVDIEIVDPSEQHEMLIYTVAECNCETLGNKLELAQEAVDLLNKRLSELDARYEKLNNMFKGIDFKYIKELLSIYESNVKKYLDGDMDDEKLSVITKLYEVFKDEMMNVDVIKYNNAIAGDLRMLNNDLAVLDQLSDVLMNAINESKPN